jgi:hypothetical protein
LVHRLHRHRETEARSDIDCIDNARDESLSIAPAQPEAVATKATPARSAGLRVDTVEAVLID